MGREGSGTVRKTRNVIDHYLYAGKKIFLKSNRNRGFWFVYNSRKRRPVTFWVFGDFQIYSASHMSRKKIWHKVNIYFSQKYENLIKINQKLLWAHDLGLNCSQILTQKYLWALNIYELERQKVFIHFY